MKVKYERKKSFLEAFYDSTRSIILDLQETSISFTHMRLLGYYKIQQDVFQQRLSKYNILEHLDTIFEGYNFFRNKLKEETS